MKAQKFELFRGCLGNGITICNKAVMEHGDYKVIGHIGDNGKLKLYVAEDYIPADAMEIIQRDVQEQRQKYLKWWNNLPVETKYSRLLGSLPIGAFLEVVAYKEMSMEEKIALMEEKYL
ncbi:MAG: hypothetical protein LUH21_04190 [Clostridiales bacterium]|nr:hypothetical protein [Clostridiales bacterium]